MIAGKWENPRRELPRLKERILVTARGLESEFEIAVFRGDAFALMSGRYQGKLLNISDVIEWMRPRRAANDDSH